MDSMTILCLGQARAVSAAAQAWPSSDATSLPTDAEVALAIESASQVARLAETIHRTAWTRLFQSSVKDTQAEGVRLREVLDHARACVREVEALFASARQNGSSRADLASLDRARVALERLDERFREGWPYLPPEELADLEARTVRPDSDYLTLEEVARGLAAPDQP